MAFRIVKDTEDRYRVIGDKDNLVGLLSKDKHPTVMWRVELMMKIDRRVSSFEQASAFVWGAEAALRAFKVLPREDINAD